MARGKHQKNKKINKINKFSKKKKNYAQFRDIKHTDQYIKYKIKMEREREKEKNKSVEKVEKNHESVECKDDPLTMLLSSFKNSKYKWCDNAAVDSEVSSDEMNSDIEMKNANDSYVKTNESNHFQKDEAEKSLRKLNIGKNETENNVENKKEEEEEEVDKDEEEEFDKDEEEKEVDDKEDEEEVDEEDEIDINDKNIEAEINNKNDPFHIHLNFDLSEALLESVSSSPITIKSSKLYWPVLHNLKVEIPKVEGTKEVSPFTTEKLFIGDEKEYAKEYCEPILIKEINFDKMYIKSQIQKNIYNANKKHAGVISKGFTNIQKELFSIINNYQDLFYCERTLEKGEEIRFVYCLHAVNHILKTRIKILHHNDRLLKKSKEQVSNEFQDQGLVRPKVIIIVPFRDSCLKIVDMMSSILLSDKKGTVINKSRFYEEFKGSELIMPKKNPKPEDYEQLFKGNIDDNFRIGISVTKKSLKLYTDFYSSDIIIASPLGLRMVIGAEGDKERDFDFLASVELLILDQTEIFLMQNWDHLLLIFEHLHVQPKESHDADFSRIRSWALNGWTKFYRQTLIFSSIQSSELNSIFNRKCVNYAGKIRVINPIEDGSICRIIVPLSHVFQKFVTDSVANSLDDRFQFFTEKIIHQCKDPAMTGVLIYVPSYFDYVRIRNYLKKNDYTFVQICEYSKDSKIARARDMFFHNESRIMLYSERFHFFRRITLKGIRHLIFYQPPTFPHFYSEICNLMQESNQNRFLGNDTLMTVNLLFCKYDIHQLSGIVKTSRAAKMVSSDKLVFMFSTG